MIEHISYLQSARMVTECYRVLRQGRCLRLVTPDLERILALAREPILNDLQARYLDFFTSTSLSKDYPSSATGGDQRPVPTLGSYIYL
jgi:hypothetical protein